VYGATLPGKIHKILYSVTPATSVAGSLPNTTDQMADVVLFIWTKETLIIVRAILYIPKQKQSGRLFGRIK